MIRLIDPAHYKTAPWKNGGGTATDIAAALDPDGEVAWRVGTAALLKDGPFSDYVGVTRTFTIVEGPGVHLDFAGEGTRTLDPDRPTRFAGAPAPFCRLRDGRTATAFNLLTRDGSASGDVSIRQGRGVPEPVGPADVVVVLTLQGDWMLGETRIAEGSAAVAEGESGLGLAASAGRAAVVTIRR